MNAVEEAAKIIVKNLRTFGYEAEQIADDLQRAGLLATPPAHEGDTNPLCNLCDVYGNSDCVTKVCQCPPHILICTAAVQHEDDILEGGALAKVYLWVLETAPHVWGPRKAWEFTQQLLEAGYRPTPSAPRDAVEREDVERLWFLFDSLAREYRGFLPDTERGHGSADTLTRNARITDASEKFRQALDALADAVEVAKVGAESAEIAKLNRLVERLRQDIANPPPDVQEKVMEMLGFNSHITAAEQRGRLAGERDGLLKAAEWLFGRAGSVKTDLETIILKQAARALRTQAIPSVARQAQAVIDLSAQVEGMREALETIAKPGAINDHEWGVECTYDHRNIAKEALRTLQGVGDLGALRCADKEVVFK